MPPDHTDDRRYQHRAEVHAGCDCDRLARALRDHAEDPGTYADREALLLAALVLEKRTAGLIVDGPGHEIAVATTAQIEGELAACRCGRARAEPTQADLDEALRLVMRGWKNVRAAIVHALVDGMLDEPEADVVRAEMRSEIGDDWHADNLFETEVE